MKCGATTRLSSRVSDRPTKLSQLLEMGELRWKLAALATGDEWALAGGAMPSNALDALAAVCERRPKRVALEHNSHADKQGRNTPASHLHGSVWWGPRPVRNAWWKMTGPWMDIE